MKKRFLIMAVCVSACMPVSALGAEIAGPAISGTAQENTDNKEETVSEEAIEKKDSGKIEDEITEVQDTVTVAADTDVLDYPGRKEGSVIGEVLEEDEISRTGTIDDIWSRILFEDDNGDIQTVRDILIKYTENKNFSGIPSREYGCEAVVGGLTRQFKLIFYLEACKWVMLV